MLDNSEVHQINTVRALLAQHHKVHWLSLVITAMALLTIGLSNDTTIGKWLLLTCGLTILLGLAQTLVAIRVGFDQQLLENLALDQQLPANLGLDQQLSENLDLAQAQDVEAARHLTQLDNSLVILGLVPQTPNKQGAQRSLIRRLKGCIKLFKYQCVLCILQLIIFFVGVLYSNMY